MAWYIVRKCDLCETAHNLRMMEVRAEDHALICKHCVEIHSIKVAKPRLKQVVKSIERGGHPASIPGPDHY